MRYILLMIVVVALVGCGMKKNEPSAQQAPSKDVQILREENQNLREQIAELRRAMKELTQPKLVLDSSQINEVINAEIRKTVGKPTGELTKADLDRVTDLILTEKQIIDLSLFKGLTKLKTLNLGGNQIADLTPIKGLIELKGLGLYNNQITDLTALVGLEALEELYLHNNRIINLSPLENLEGLQLLDLENNPKLTKAEINKLQKALPKCEIKHNAKK